MHVVRLTTVSRPNRQNVVHVGRGHSDQRSLVNQKTYETVWRTNCMFSARKRPKTKAPRVAANNDTIVVVYLRTRYRIRIRRTRGPPSRADIVVGLERGPSVALFSSPLSSRSNNKKKNRVVASTWRSPPEPENERRDRFLKPRKPLTQYFRKP